MCYIQAAYYALAAYAAWQSSESNNKAQDYNKAVAETNAKTSEIKAQDAAARGEQEVINQNRKTAALRGQQRAQLAARGLDLTYGSTQAAIDQTDYFGKVDANTIRDNAKKESWAYRVDKANYEAEAKFASASKTDSFMAATTAGLTAWAGGVSSKWAPAAKTQSQDAWGVGEGDMKTGLSGGRTYGGLGLKPKW